MNIYNIIAELCALVIKNCTEDFFVRYSCVSAAEKARVNEIVRSTVGILFSEKGEIRPLSKTDLTESFFSDLNQLVASFTETQDFFAIVGLTQILDEALSLLLKEKTAEFQKDDFSVVLNTNREQTGIGLLPRCSCVWERKHRLSHSYNRMDNFLFNMLLMENSILGELIDKHFFLKNDLFPHFAQTRSLKVAATPLRMERGFDVIPYSKDKVNYFRIEYKNAGIGAVRSQNMPDGFGKLNHREDPNALVWQKILEAAQNRSDIIVFPEMLGNPTLADFISQKIKSLPKDEAEYIPSLIILPSFWGEKGNTVTILDRKGNVICKQKKQNPFRAEVGGESYLEGILSSLVVNIFHYEGIGRFAVLICKDFLTTKYMEQLMRCFKLTLIIVPSFSTGSYDFRQSFDLCAHDDCNVVWINTCAALEKGKEANFENIGYVRKRISRSDDEAQTLCKMPICAGAFKGECKQDCLYYETIGGV